MSKSRIHQVGRIGGFPLCLPALSGALAFYDETILFTRSSYHSLPDNSDSLTLKALMRTWIPWGSASGSDVITFWRDEEWKRELGRRIGKSLFSGIPANRMRSFFPYDVLET